MKPGGFKALITVGNLRTIFLNYCLHLLKARERQCYKNIKIAISKIFEIKKKMQVIL